MSLAAVALVLAVADPQEVTAVKVASLGARTAVRVVTAGVVAAAEVARQGDEVVVRLPVPAASDLTTPPAQKPIERIRVTREVAATLVRLKVAPEVSFVTSREPGATVIVFSEPPPAQPTAFIPPELYARLFPTGFLETEAPPAVRSETGRDGLALGRLTLRPSLQVAYVNADITVFGPQPVHDRYLQVAPAIVVLSPVLDGQFTAGYQPRFRFFSHLPQVGESSQLADAGLDEPLGPRVRLRAAYSYSRATLETYLVDPGREYFYDLSRFTMQTTTVGATVDVAPRLFVEAQAGWWWSRFDQQQAGFIGYDSRTLRAGLGYDLDRELKAVLGYSYESVPPAPGRPIVESTAHNIDATLTGPIGPLMTGRISAGYRTQTSPQATGASNGWSGFVVGGSLRRELGQSTSVELGLNRTSTVSAFETNAYYVTNSVTLALNAPLPFQAWGRASGSFLRNDYPNPASAIGAPRRDDVLGFGLGLGRSLGRRASLQADYRRERRDSNIPGYSITTDGFIVQVNLGFTGAGR